MSESSGTPWSDNAELAARQERLLSSVERSRGRPLPEPIRAAIRRCPRHLFLERYKRRDDVAWSDAATASAAELDRMYQDEPLALIHRTGEVVLSAQSTPSFVFTLLEALEIGPGQTVLEIGSGSGWLTAVIAALVSPGGSVDGVEIFPELVALSRRAMVRAAIENVRLFESDGASPMPPGPPYDRVLITACSRDLPAWMHDRVRTGGRLAVPIEIPGGGDCMFLLTRQEGHFRSTHFTFSLSVPMSGRYESAGPRISHVPAHIATRQTRKRPEMLPWHGDRRGNFIQQTLSCRAYLSVATPGFVVHNMDPTGTPLTTRNLGFGVSDPDDGSLALATADGIVTYGSGAAGDRLVEAISAWAALGKPDQMVFEVEIHPLGASIEPAPGRFVQRREGSIFVWKLSH